MQILYYALTIVLGGLIGFFGRKLFFEREMDSAKNIAQKMIEEGQKEAAIIKKDANIKGQDIIFKMKANVEREFNERRVEVKKQEDRLSQKEEHYAKRSEQLVQREADTSKYELELVKIEKQNQVKAQELERAVSKQTEKLEEIALYTANEAKEELLKAMEEEARHEGAKTIRHIEMETKEIADKKAKNILALAMKRYAGEYVAEHTISVVALPNEEMKGRIIGREGRNIRALEAATGVDLIIDDTPEAVLLSGFSPIRREIARLSLERLIADGRIHPARIEEVVEKVTEEIALLVKEAGERATFDVGVHGIHPELIKILGKLKYRTSYTQNVLLHSIEVAFLCGIMADELGLNAKQAKRAGLLHDIGKAVDHEIEGSHAVIGADLAKRYGESPEVIQSIMAHHEDIEPESVLDVLVQTADTLSGARPGARREMLETYVKRLDDLEKIATSFQGVLKTYAIQAGREVRIIVQSDQVSDDAALVMAKDICRKVENEMVYPGQIKVTVIRETRAVDFAK